MFFFCNYIKELSSGESLGSTEAFPAVDCQSNRVIPPHTPLQQFTWKEAPGRLFFLVADKV